VFYREKCRRAGMPEQNENIFSQILNDGTKLVLPKTII